MPKLRYAIAALFFAASVGCLALWWRSYTYLDAFSGPSYVLQSQAVTIEFVDGMAGFAIVETSPTTINAGFGAEWQYNSSDTESLDSLRDNISWMKKTFGRFYFSTESVSAYFPIWYAALVFALADIGVLRFRRQFSIRSALIATTVVAALIGMAVML